MSSAAAPSNEVHNLNVLLGLLFFSTLMGTVPFAAFAASYYGYLDSFYQHTFGVPSADQRVIYSGVVAVVAVNIVIAAYVVKAFREPLPPSAEEAKKKL